MPGLVLRTNCSVGDQVKTGQSLLTLEAMKMEVQVSSPCDGRVVSTGEVQGDRPYSWIKITLAVLGGLLAVGGIVLAMNQ